MGDAHSLIGIVIAGIIVGWLASLLVHGKGMGILPDMVVGIVGAFIGTVLSDKFNIHLANGFWGSFALSILGAVILLVFIRLVKPAN